MKLSTNADALVKLGTWVCHANKVPRTVKNTAASSTDPSTWTTYEAAVDAVNKSGGLLDGVGFVFTEDGKIAGVDLDNVVSVINGEEVLRPEAKEILERFNSYTEYSPSKRGLHIFGYGHVARSFNAKVHPDTADEYGVEAYSKGRYFTVTGQTYLGYNVPLADIGAALEWLCAKYGKPSKAAAEAAAPVGNGNGNGNGNGKGRPMGDASKASFWAAFSAIYGPPDSIETIEAVLRLSGFEVLGRVEGGVSVVSPHADQYKTPSNGKDWLVYPWFHNNGFHSHDAVIPTNGIDFIKRYLPQVAAKVDAQVAEYKKKAKEEYKAKQAQAQQSEDGKNPLVILGASDVAKSLIAEHPVYSYVPDRNVMYKWNGKYWQALSDNALCGDIFEHIEALLPTVEHAESFTYLRKKAQKEHTALVRAMKSIPSIYKRAEDFDTHDEYINTAGGIVCLAEGKFSLIDHDPSYMFTKMSPVDIRNSAMNECPLFFAFLEKFTSANGVPDRAKAVFLQKLAGLSLLGHNKAKIFVVLIGPSNSMKSAFVGMLTKMLGSDYSGTIDAEAVTVRHHESRFGWSPTIGKRIVTCQEIGEGEKLKAAKVKAATGGSSEPMSIEGKYMNAVTVNPGFTLFITTNTEPDIDDKSDAVFKRMQVIPCVYDNQNPDITMADRIAKEINGIFLWALKGLERYYAEGLIRPACVVEYSNAMKSAADPLEPFLRTCVGKNPASSVSSIDLYKAYKIWCERTEDNTKYVVSHKTFSKELRTRFGMLGVRKASGVYYSGYSLDSSKLPGPSDGVAFSFSDGFDPEPPKAAPVAQPKPSINDIVAAKIGTKLAALKAKN